MFMLSEGLKIFSSVAGEGLSAESDAMAAEERARVDRFNAIVAEQEAKSEIDGARADASDFRRAQSARLASARARRAGSGFAAEGSPLMVDEATLTEMEFGVSRIIHAGQLRATRKKNEATLLARSAKTEKTNAKLARQAGVINQVGAGVSGIADTYKTALTLGASFG